MRRTDLSLIIDGQHPDHGRGVALAHQGLILASAIAISVETVPGLPGWAFSALLQFEFAVLCVFCGEYLLRLACAERPWRYALSLWGVVDLLAWLPLLAFVAPELAAMRALRLFRLVRLLKLLHTNRALLRLQAALRRVRGELIIFAFLACIILYIAAVGIYIFEHEAQPNAFASIPVSLWWAIVSFTTVGYGDIYPITPEGRIFTAVVLFIGLGVIAVPTALITSALINTDLRDEIERDLEEAERKAHSLRHRLPKQKSGRKP